MEKHYSTPVNWIGEEHLGFVINAAFSQENIERIVTWLDGLHRRVPEGIYPMTSTGLHITVLDWVAPLFGYEGADKRALFTELNETYEPAFKAITDGMDSFDVHFNEVKVTPGTIILIGHDDGQFQTLRDTFMQSVRLPEGGKQPPTIIHSSIARFIAPEIDLAPVEEYAASHPLELTQRIDEFRLVETRREPMQDFTVLENFKLAS